MYNLTKEEEWLFWHDVDEWDQLSALFFVHRSSIELLRKYHYILFLDCTYKTNRYGMPLLIITSTTACNLTFYVGFCFLQQETTGFYEWAVGRLHNLFVINGLADPVMVTDKEDALIRALNKIFPTSPLIQCRWHINKNIKSHMEKAEFDDVEEAKQWEKAWHATINSSTEELYDENLAHLQTLNSTMYTYVAKEYLGSQAVKIVTCFIDKFLHFGKLVTSTGESGHAALKSQLSSSMGNLRDVVGKVRDGIIHQSQEIYSVHSKAKIEFDTTMMKIGAFRHLNGFISVKGLRKLHEQLLRLTKNVTCIVPCTHTFEKTMGLPCAHKIHQSLFDKEPLYPKDCHLQWHLDPAIVDQPTDIDPLRIIQDPVKKTRGKGRPAHDTSTKRDKSRFEHLGVIAKKAAKKVAAEERAQGSQRREQMPVFRTFNPEDSGSSPPTQLSKEEQNERDRQKAADCRAEIAAQKGVEKATKAAASDEKRKIITELEGLGASKKQIRELYQKPPCSFDFGLYLLRHGLMLDKLIKAADEEDMELNSEVYNDRLIGSGGRDKSWDQIPLHLHSRAQQKEKDEFDKWAKETGYQQKQLRRGEAMLALEAWEAHQAIHPYKGIRSQAVEQIDQGQAQTDVEEGDGTESELGPRRRQPTQHVRDLVNEGRNLNGTKKTASRAASSPIKKTRPSKRVRIEEEGDTTAGL